MTQIYQVKSGESLKSIAASTLGDARRWPELAYANGLQHPYIVRTGQVIELPDSSNPVTLVASVPNSNAPAVAQANNQLSPAEWGLLAVGAFVIWRWL